MIARKHALTALAGITLLAGGCKSTPYEGQKGLVENRLDEAEDEGAAKAELQAVRDTLDMAKAEEERAAKDQMKAQDDLEWSRKELPAARSRVNALEREVLDIQDELNRAREHKSRLDAERDDMIARGLSEAQADSVVDADRNVLELRITELEREEAALNERLALANLDRKTAEGYVNAANDRLTAAQKRVALSSTLYQLADAQSRALEAEALGVRRSELMERMDEPTPIPATTEEKPIEEKPIEETGEFQEQQQDQIEELPAVEEPKPIEELPPQENAPR